MGLRERRLTQLNQVIEQQGFGEIILDKGAIFELLEILRDALDEIDTNPEKALVMGVLIDQKVQSSIAPGVLAARIISVVGIHVGELTPLIKGYTTQQLVNRIDCFMENFDV